MPSSPSPAAHAGNGNAAGRATPSTLKPIEHGHQANRHPGVPAPHGHHPEMGTAILRDVPFPAAQRKQPFLQSRLHEEPLVRPRHRRRRKHHRPRDENAELRLHRSRTNPKRRHPGMNGPDLNATAFLPFPHHNGSRQPQP